MGKKITYSFETDKDLKKEAEKLCKYLGIDLPVALNMFMTRMVQSDGIPFKVEGNKLNKRAVKAVNTVHRMKEDREKSIS